MADVLDTRPRLDTAQSIWLEMRTMRSDLIEGVSGKRVSDDALRNAYAEYRNIRKVADVVGLCSQNVHERLNRLGISTPRRFPTLSDQEAERLRRDYLDYRDRGALDLLAAEMNRNKTTLVMFARRLRLTTRNGKGRRRLDRAIWKYMDEHQATLVWDKFKASRLGLGAYCRKFKYDDLGFSRKMKEFFADEWDHVMESKAPRQGLYRVGRQLEYRVRDWLEKHRYFVLRSPASKSPVDLVGIKKGEILFVQSKKAGTLGVAEWNAIYSLSLSVGALPLMATGHPSGRGVIFKLLTGTKDGSKHRQPWSDWSVEAQTSPQETLL